MKKDGKFESHAGTDDLPHELDELLRSAVASRDRIGQAKGIVIERFHVDDVQAFAMLRRLSQEWA